MKLQISQTKGAPRNYDAVIEEIWASPTLWMRTVKAENLSQTTVVDDSGIHIFTSGDYYPMWLRSFVTALFTPVPNANEWNLSKTPLEHVEMPNGVRSNPCQHAEFYLGVPPITQINFANVCFQPDGLLDFVGSPSYSMEFHDYVPFEHLRIARTLIDHPFHGVELTGKVVLLESENVDTKQISASPEAVSADPLSSVMLSSSQMEQLSGGTPLFQWPQPIPGHGMFTVLVSVDKTGTVREAHPLNSDESGIAADMSAQLIGKKWKTAVIKGIPTQVQGALVVVYPPTNEQ